jgi:hypothetical protein
MVMRKLILLLKQNNWCGDGNLILLLTNNHSPITNLPLLSPPENRIILQDKADFFPARPDILKRKNYGKTKAISKRRLKSPSRRSSILVCYKNPRNILLSL